MQYLKSINHPHEIVSLFKIGNIYLKKNKKKKYNQIFINNDENNESKLILDKIWCNKILFKISKSFELAGDFLNPEIRDIVTIFYLVLRGLKTIEDDTQNDLNKRLPLLKQFADNLYQSGYKIDGYGLYNEEIELMENFNTVVNVFNNFNKEYCEIIYDITQRMSFGIQEFLQRSIITIEDWNSYCYYVSGLASIGLNRIFYTSGIEGEWFKNNSEKANQMGLFLQKANLIRNFLKDYNEGRYFWPSQILHQFNLNYENILDIKNQNDALFCLNYLITNSLKHVVDSIEYVSNLKNNDSIIPILFQLTISFLSIYKCYNNYKVFEGGFKIRLGQKVYIMENIKNNNISSLYRFFLIYSYKLQKKISSNDPSYKKTIQLIDTIQKVCLNYIK